MDHKTLLPTKRKIVFSILLSIIFTALTVLTILIDIVPIPEYIILEYLPLSNFLTFATLCFYINAPKGFLILHCAVQFSHKRQID